LVCVSVAISIETKPAHQLVIDLRKQQYVFHSRPWETLARIALTYDEIL